jgi:uncharacterized LabA/DUF88 family protein
MFIMTKKIGVFVDTNNLYYNVHKKYNKKIDYELYLKQIMEMEKEECIYRAFAYGSYLEDNGTKFIQYLKYAGFHPIYNLVDKIRRGKWNTYMLMDVVRMHDRLDTLVIGSSDPNLMPLIQWTMDKGIRTLIFSCNISKALKEFCYQWIEIQENILIN